MRTSMLYYADSAATFDRTAAEVRSSWSDDVGASFYSQIIEPIQQESMEMRNAMEILVEKLYDIKSQIDAI